MDQRIGTNFEFAGYRFDEFGNVLKRGDEIVPLEPRAFMLLRYLALHRDRIVSKDEIVSALWDDRAISDAALNTQIRSIRRALGDDRETQKFIRTYPKRGFRFVAPIEQASVIPQSPPPVRRRWRPGFAALLSMIVAVSLLVLALQGLPALWQSGTTGTGQRPSLAVLAFKNLSDDPGEDYFAMGLTEDLSIKLARYRDLFVVSHRSSRMVGDSGDDVRRVARSLGAEYVVRGSSRKNGDRVRINVQLLDGTTGHILWGDTLERTLSDIFKLQHELAHSIAGQLTPQISKARNAWTLKQPTRELKAWDLYIRARLTQTELAKEKQIAALQLTNRAISLDRSFAAAYSLKAQIKGNLFFQQWTRAPEKTLHEAIEYGKKAITLDPDNPGAYASLGYIYRYTGDEERAISNLQRAKALNPSDAVIRLQLAHTLDWFRQQKLALPEINEALKLSPRDPLLQKILFFKSHILFHLERFEESISTLKKMRSVINSRRWELFYHLMRAASSAELGLMDQARENIDAALAIKPKLSVTALKKLFDRSKNHPENRKNWLSALQKAGLPA